MNMTFDDISNRCIFFLFIGKTTYYINFRNFQDVFNKKDSRIFL